MNNTVTNSKQWFKQILLSDMTEGVVSLCKYKTCLALIYEMGMFVNSTFMGWEKSVVSRIPQIHVLAIRFLAETFILFILHPNYNLESYLNIHHYSMSP